MTNELNNRDKPGTGMTEEQVTQIMRKMAVDFRTLQINRATPMAREMIARFKRDVGIDLLKKNPDAEALLTEFNRKLANDLFNKICAATEQRFGFKI